MLAGLSLGRAYAQSAQPRTEQVVLQLKWRHQFQFAGYYMAAAKGYYRDAGLDVVIREAEPSTQFTDTVVQGKAQYGINNTDLLIDRVKGKKPVVVLAVIFQHSPLVLLSLAKSGLSTPADYAGKRIMVSLDAEAEIFSMFANESVPLSAVNFVQHSWDLEDLVAGRVDAISAYSTNEPIILRTRGIASSMTRPLTYGIDFYGDCLFTSEAELKSHPARAAAFLSASLKGWEYAMEHVEEGADLILGSYRTGKTRSELLDEARAMDELIVHRLVPLGFMNPGRWRHIGETYARLGVIPKGYSLDGLMYNPSAPGIDPRVIRILILVLAVASVGSISYIVVLRAFNSRLAVEVSARTKSLAGLNDELTVEMRQRAQKERELADSLAEKEVLLKEIHHRVKNNLQIISSIVSLQLEKSDSEEVSGMLKEIRSRVFSMALVHEQLYERGNLARIDMDDYLLRLVSEIKASFRTASTEVSSVVSAQGISLSVREAIPLGLVVSELVTNSMKFAFPSRPQGRIEIRLREEGDLRILEVSDDGVGLERDSGKERHAGLGIDLVSALAAQLGGTISYPEAKGFRVLITMPLSY